MENQQGKDSASDHGETLLINGVKDHDAEAQDAAVKPAAAPEAVAPSSAPKETPGGPRGLLPLTSKKPCFLSPPSPLRLPDAPPEPASGDASAHAISLTSCATKGLSSWSLPGDGERTLFAIMEPGGLSALTGDCLIQPSRTCLGCFIEAKDGLDAEPGISLKAGEGHRDEDPCSGSDLGLPSLNPAEGIRFGDQLLSDQLLGFPPPRPRAGERRDADRSDSDSEDPAPRNYYEGLLLDRCPGEETLLPNPSQEWGYFESFISESKIELLDLCSKNELSVNLFSEEDVDNYMFDDDDSTLGSDVCSLKIRYESFQDGLREKTGGPGGGLQEDAQFNFFPGVFAAATACPKRELKAGGLRRGGDEPPRFKAPGESILWGEEEEELDGGAEPAPFVGSAQSPFLDSPDYLGEFSDDSSGTDASFDALPGVRGHAGFLAPDPLCGSASSSSSSPSFSSSSSSSSIQQQNYGLRVKRKVRYSDDYLYDVDSIESEKAPEKKEWAPGGPKEEDDDEWCPKKRRKASRKEPPVIIKYIIINRFKGEKHMLVKLGKVDAGEATVTLSDARLGQYARLAPLKAFWQEQRRGGLTDPDRASPGLGPGACPNGALAPFPPHPRKRKCSLAHRHRIQRIQAVEQAVGRPGSSGYDQKPGGGGGSRDEAGLRGVLQALALAPPSGYANGLHPGGPGKCRAHEGPGPERKVLRRIKFKSEARLKCKKAKARRPEAGRPGLVAPVASPAASDRDAGSGPRDEEGGPSRGPAEEPGPKPSFPPAARSPGPPPPAAGLPTGMPVIPGGYLQTLLDASDLSGNSGISYFASSPAGPPRAGDLVPPEKPFAAAAAAPPPAQSCVLSPPSESELQESPRHLELEALWPGKAAAATPGGPPDFGAEAAPALSNEFGSPAAGAPGDGLAPSAFGPGKYPQDGQLPPDAAYPPCPFNRAEGCFPFQRGPLGADGRGPLVGFDSVGPLAVGPAGYGSLSLKPPCEKDGEDEMGDDFLAHCSPKLVIQQSLDEIAPLKESSDLLDISNFTPDKFRHSSLSEMSPPDTPSLSPQAAGAEGAKALGTLKGFQEGAPGPPGGDKAKWDRGPPAPGQAEDGFAQRPQFQFHMFNDEDSVGPSPAFGEPPGPQGASGKGSRSRKKNSPGNKAGAAAAAATSSSSPPSSGPAVSPPKSARKKSPRAAAGKGAEKPPGKAGRQPSKGTRKGKGAAGAQGERGLAGGGRGAAPLPATGKAPAGEGARSGASAAPAKRAGPGRPAGEWEPGRDGGGGWTAPGLGRPGGLMDDDQREFEEPSNILSNIASGMADVQRFMMASLEPLWGPVGLHGVPDIFRSPDSNSLKLKTLKILAGTPQEAKRKASGGAPGAAKNHRATKGSARSNGKAAAGDPGRAGGPGFSPDCHVPFFDKNYSHLSTLGNKEPTHKKLYRHKSSAKALRDENCKGKRTEREQTHKEAAGTASFEKLRESDDQLLKAGTACGVLPVFEEEARSFLERRSMFLFLVSLEICLVVR
ncbi:LOW QUALITY PROTEIN: neurite extension and migration factor [Tachyglossus aculeatus]|uniref:LOW QUALITY PROTEIN: neurite extension and migration factor n=1 Tax=Tachyglossus aculeatus TaxID=9261 RepID=UPI0018F673AE|nr:LOW QUALITY PROTEIN: neurite extension and migration factor [Tachyglossus aculeatus]